VTNQSLRDPFSRLRAHRALVFGDLSRRTRGSHRPTLRNGYHHELIPNMREVPKTNLTTDSVAWSSVLISDAEGLLFLFGRNRTAPSDAPGRSTVPCHRRSGKSSASRA
jgi:hypothetical protein